MQGTFIWFVGQSLVTVFVHGGREELRPLSADGVRRLAPLKENAARGAWALSGADRVQSTHKLGLKSRHTHASLAAIAHTPGFQTVIFTGFPRVCALSIRTSATCATCADG